jgi:hypothetical protein
MYRNTASTVVSSIKKDTGFRKALFRTVILAKKVVLAYIGSQNATTPD